MCAGEERERSALLCVLGLREDGTKELLAMKLGYRESTQSWAEVLRDLRERGLQTPLLAIGDGALGLWATLPEVFPQTEHQRCWNHTIRTQSAIARSGVWGSGRSSAEWDDMANLQGVLADDNPFDQHQSMRSQFAQVVAELAQAVVRLGQPMAGQQPGVDLAGGPVSDEGAGVHQPLQQPDHPIIFQLQSRDAARADQDGTRQARQCPAVHGARQHLGLGVKIAGCWSLASAA